MRLAQYWGIGPKTERTLLEELGQERAIAAVESGDVSELTAAGIPRGRANGILRRSTGAGGMDRFATRDARAAYKAVLSVLVEHALTERAADRISVMTPLNDPEDVETRLEDVWEAKVAWEALAEATRDAIVDTFSRYDDRGGDERAAVDAALELAELDLEADPFGPLAELDHEKLDAATAALAGLATASGSHTDRVGPGADTELDRLRAALGAMDDLGADSETILEEARSSGAQGMAGFRDAIEDRLLSVEGLTVDRVREAMPADAADATDFVDRTIRSVRASLQSAIDEREATVRTDLEATLDDASDAIDLAVTTVETLAVSLSLARFAVAYDCTRPEIVDGAEHRLLVEEARNLTLAASESTSVQPITYALGTADVEVDGSAPGDERVAVLTGANSGGKTTLLETLCQVVVLAMMGLPVPADRAEVTPVDALVFHRRHASFNAGVLEATLRSVVPPLAADGRTLMLVDEFEAITEPGSAADLLHGLVSLTVDRDALGVFVTHLADDLEPLPTAARVDGIFAEGLSADLDLLVDYQPRFDTVGRSTPEFIVSRLVANATDRTERVGFEKLAEAVGQDIVQRTLADARWTEATADK